MPRRSIVDDDLDENHGEDNEPETDEALDELEPVFEAEIDPELEQHDVHEIDQEL